MKKGNILGNNPKTGYDNVFQLGEFVDPYRVASSIDLEENSKFCVLEIIFVDVDVKELNVVFSSNEHAQVDTDDYNDEINIEDWDGDDAKSIEEEEDNSDYFAKYESVMS